MQPLIEYLGDRWRCNPCKLEIEGRQDAETHGRIVHGVPADQLACDPDGHYYDTRKPEVLRAMGLM